MDKKVITPDIWGPHGWKFLHYLSFGYPMNPTTEQKNQYKTFFYHFNMSYLALYVRNIILKILWNIL